MPRKLTENELKLMKLTYLSEFNEVLNELLLSDTQKEVFKLFYQNRKTMLQISIELNLDIKAVRTAIKEISSKLANYIF